MPSFKINQMPILPSEELSQADLLLLTRPSTLQNFNVASSVFQTVKEFNVFQNNNITFIGELSTNLANQIKALQTNLGITNINISANFLKHPLIALNASNFAPVLYSSTGQTLSAVSPQTFLSYSLPQVNNNDVLIKSNGVWQGAPYVPSSVLQDIENLKTQYETLSSTLRVLDSYTRGLLNGEFFSFLNAVDNKNNSTLTTLTNLNTSLTNRINTLQYRLDELIQNLNGLSYDKRILSLSVTLNSIQIKISEFETLLNDKVAQAQSKSWINSAIPIGTILYYVGVSAPDGWLFCDGSLVKKTSYPQLFNIMKVWISDIKGRGIFDGNGNEILTNENFLDPKNPNFRLPDLRGQFIRGWDTGKGIDHLRVFGSYQVDMFKSHYHEIKDTGGPEGDDSGYMDIGNDGSNGSLKKSFTELQGGIETRPRNVAYLPIIKALNI